MYRKRILCISLILIIILGMCACTNPFKPQTKPTEEPAPAYSMDYLVLVNRDNPLPEDWEEHLECEYFVNAVGDTVAVEKTAYAEYLRMKETLEKENIFVDLDSAYRSVKVQQETWDEFMVKYGEEYTKAYVAVPGYSEHHTGLALDLFLIVDGKIIYENEDLVTYPEIWARIHELAPEYGFILRYLEGKEDITGYNYEPWHLRYVGPGIAREITDDGLTLEEYLEQHK
ncbi:MAG: M15 family metallopeptidase [Eubacteriaceae bacterium]|nr:M15 family metallopeptidase [Eubacteriaceae bacterium]